jgi:hypothetical protein
MEGRRNHIMVNMKKGRQESQRKERGTGRKEGDVWRGREEGRGRQEGREGGEVTTALSGTELLFPVSSDLCFGRT